MTAMQSKYANSFGQFCVCAILSQSHMCLGVWFLYEIAGIAISIAGNNRKIITFIIVLYIIR